MTMDKPREIVRFQLLALAGCLINAVVALIVLHFALAAVLGVALGVVITVGLVLWVVLGRSFIARIMLTIWLAYGIVATLVRYAAFLGQYSVPLNPLILGVSLVTLALNAVALFFLWSRPASLWLLAKKDVAPPTANP